MTIKEITHITQGMPTADGAGVKLTRYIGTPELKELDPFLMLDFFESDNPDDYIAGFPPHPHRGFETVTYLLNGRMRHKDNQGNEGVVLPGGVQWMTAGSGVIHSEMPEQENGLLQGFQLWINLPSHAKMQDPQYQDFAPEAMPVEQHPHSQIRVITGTTPNGTTGPVKNHYIDPLYFDVELDANQTFTQPFKSEDSQGFIFVIDGRLTIGEQNRPLKPKQLAVLSKGTELHVSAMENSRFLLIAGNPIQEPIARSGPFVMNTQAELKQAFDDFRNNRF
ncbi:quercetin 2,3-dioxygenase [Hydrogenovibrio sp. SC-1]|uniref:pirin family protein n=1 Tax=Hydrogenovibrio sp. SC-1 TaxID=2065820 RepID=UPI000C7B539F|nr:pirin family protein [Hydrogenovibrio sp. SC-1]PLA74570.1 quercetin 2,3-dioxygenase [Hydrogenovibrio sp. SC-1]